MLSRLNTASTVFLSGWANSTSGMHFGADHTVPLSDHADFNELLEYVRAVDPSFVYVTHGDKEFVTYLEKIGYKATFLNND